LPEVRRLSLIRARVNRAFGYASDEDAWGVAGYWETPTEVAARGATDCEGFAIFKPWLARIAGIDDRRMGIYVGQIRDGAQHAVLLVQAEGGDVALDSLPASMSPASRPSR
jgi:predicted transglutaminase-like cysteine proteinase